MQLPLLRSDPATKPKPRKVSATLSAGNYRWMIGNASAGCCLPLRHGPRFRAIMEFGN